MTKPGPKSRSESVASAHSMRRRESDVDTNRGVASNTNGTTGQRKVGGRTISVSANAGAGNVTEGVARETPTQSQIRRIMSKNIPGGVKGDEYKKSANLLNAKLNPKKDPQFVELKGLLFKEGYRTNSLSSLENKEVHEIYKTLKRRGTLDVFIATIKEVNGRDFGPDLLPFIQKRLIAVASDNNHGKTGLENFLNFYDSILNIRPEGSLKTAVEMATLPGVNGQVIDKVATLNEKFGRFALQDLFHEAIKPGFDTEILEEIMKMTDNFRVGTPFPVFVIRAFSNIMNEIETSNDFSGMTELLRDAG